MQNKKGENKGMRTTRCRSLFVVGAIALLVAGIAFIPAPAMAQAPASIFQLDGNSAQTAGYPTCTYGGVPTTCDYWNLINLAGSSGFGRGHSGVNSFILGTASTDSFTGGGSKDSNLLSQWAYSTTPTPNKDTLNAGYAAAYSVSDFDVIFGADRLSPNGDANIGIWFFQQNVTLNGTGGFNGAHVNGDVFVISAFTGGGGTSSIFVYEWDSACASGVKNPGPGQCAASNLRLLADPTTVCGASPYCAITNTGTVNASWASYSGGTLASPLFFEGGVDITAAFAAIGKPVPCFSSFLEETRSSQSTTAVLKDFLLGGFNVCSMSLTKTCGTASVNAAGTQITYPVGGVVTNTGIGTLSDVQVQDCIGGSWSVVNGVETCSGTAGTLNVTNNTTGSQYNGTSTLAKGDSGTWSDSSTSTAGTESDQAFAVAATSVGGAQTLQSTNTASASCALAVSTTLTVSKSCKTTLQVNSGQVAVQVSYGGQICNTGASQVTGIALTDYPDSSNTTGAGTGVTSGITLGPGTVANPTCQSYGPFTYSPTLIDQTVVGNDGIAGDGAGRYFFSDLITISSASAKVGGLTKITGTGDARIDGSYGDATASCPICQGSGECTIP